MKKADIELIELHETLQRKHIEHSHQQQHLIQLNQQVDQAKQLRAQQEQQQHDRPQADSTTVEVNEITNYVNTLSIDKVGQVLNGTAESTLIALIGQSNIRDAVCN